jgi:hypothetical protein
MELAITQFEAREGASNRANGSGRYNGYGYGRFAKTRIYIWTERQTILQSFVARGSEPHVAYRKHVLPEVLERLGLPAGTKAPWSRTAGCGCGCSPAFVVDTPNPMGIEVFVTVGEGRPDGAG